MFPRLKELFRGSRGSAARQQGDPHALDRAGDPRGGVQSDAYRTAEPTEVVEESGVAMSGPGGAPQEGESVEELRDRDRDSLGG